jgi:hypothetical protein
MKSNVQFKLKDASFVLGVSPKDLQNLVQFGVLRPQRQNRFFVFDSSALLQAKVAFYLKESLGTSVPLLARFTKEIFKNMPVAKSGQARNISILSRPLRGKKPVRIEIPLQALAAELAAQLPATESPRKLVRGAERNRWKEEITRTFAEAADDLKGITEREILDEIKRYRAERRKSPEITVVALPEEKTA